MNTKELSDAEKAEKRDEAIKNKSPHIVITKPYGKWKKGDRPTVLQWKADELVRLNVAEYDNGFLTKTLNKFRNGK